MKQKDKSKSTWVAATLLAGAVFILSVALQHWPTDTLLPTPITPEHLTISKSIDSPVLVGEIEQIVANLLDNAISFSGDNKDVIVKVSKLENDNVLITTVGGGGRSLEVNSNGDIVWEANYNLSLPSGAVYRAHRIPGLFPAAFSVLVHDLYEMVEGNGVYLIPGSSSVSFEVVNNGDYELALNYTFTDLAGWFEPTEGNLVLPPGSSETLSFTGDIPGSTETTVIELVMTPDHHPEKQKVIQLIGVPNYLGNDPEIVPTTFQLYEPFPNPFNPTATIRFYMGVETRHAVSHLQIFDITGRVVETLVNENLVPGEHDVVWDANNQVSGIYFVELVSGQNRSVQKLVLLK